MMQRNVVLLTMWRGPRASSLSRLLEDLLGRHTFNSHFLHREQRSLRREGGGGVTQRCDEQRESNRAGNKKEINSESAVSHTLTFDCLIVLVPTPPLHSHSLSFVIPSTYSSLVPLCRLLPPSSLLSTLCKSEKCRRPDPFQCVCWSSSCVWTFRTFSLCPSSDSEIGVGWDFSSVRTWFQSHERHDSLGRLFSVTTATFQAKTQHSQTGTFQSGICGHWHGHPAAGLSSSNGVLLQSHLMF